MVCVERALANTGPRAGNSRAAAAAHIDVQLFVVRLAKDPPIPHGVLSKVTSHALGAHKAAGVPLFVVCNEAVRLDSARAGVARVGQRLPAHFIALERLQPLRSGHALHLALLLFLLFLLLAHLLLQSRFLQFLCILLLRPLSDLSLSLFHLLQALLLFALFLLPFPPSSFHPPCFLLPALLSLFGLALFFRLLPPGIFKPPLFRFLILSLLLLLLGCSSSKCSCRLFRVFHCMHACRPPRGREDFRKHGIKVGFEQGGVAEWARCGCGGRSGGRRCGGGGGGRDGQGTRGLV
mmetsp:Transcript_42236/g.106549  ORF Transcript_42236/g.106549 Transcript_42236/m.106549 type:complete len:293 (-) Transcript_42236:1008-1886(-)